MYKKMKVVKFYGLQYSEVNNLSAKEFYDFYSSIEMFENQELLKSCFIADWPNQKKSVRESKHKEFHKKAHPNIWEGASKPVKIEDLQKILKGFK